MAVVRLQQQQPEPEPPQPAPPQPATKAAEQADLIVGSIKAYLDAREKVVKGSLWYLNDRLDELDAKHRDHIRTLDDKVRELRELLELLDTRMTGLLSR